MPPWLMLTIDGVLLLTLVATLPWMRIRGRGAPIVVLALLCAGGISWPWLHDREIKIDPTVELDGQLVTGDWVIFELDSWVGKDIGDTEFALIHEDPYTLPDTGLWVFWRSTCDHCAEHMRQLKEEDDGSRMFVLIRLHETHDTVGNKVVHEMPEGPHVIHVDMPDSLEYLITTPGELEMEAFMVVRGAEAVGMDEEERKEAEAEHQATSSEREDG